MNIEQQFAERTVNAPGIGIQITPDYFQFGSFMVTAFICGYVACWLNNRNSKRNPTVVDQHIPAEWPPLAGG
jgi:hypothetical protein